MKRILLVEDSEEFHKIVARALARHQIVCTTTVEEASRLLREQPVDLVILDIALPGKSGLSLLSELSLSGSRAKIPVICLTGRSEISDKLAAFSLGADDYVVKPFDPIEFRARVDSKLAKAEALHATHSTTVIGELEIDLASHRVVLLENGNRTEVQVTQTEFKILSCLARQPDRVFTRDQLLVAAWGEDARVLDRVVDVHVCSLRKKLGDYGKCIQAVPRMGYRFVLPAPAVKDVA